MKLSPKISLLMYSMRGGGAENVTLSLAREFRKRGLGVEIVLFKARGELLERAKKIAPIHDLKISRMETAVFRLASYFRRNQPQVVISGLTRVNIIASAAKILSRANFKLMLVEHSATFERQLTEANSIKSKAIPILMRKFYSKADVVAAVSQGALDSLLSNFKIRPRRSVVLYNPLEIEYIQRMSLEPAHHKWLEEDSIPLIVAAGRLEPQKDYLTLLKSFAQVCSGHQARLIILGNGSLKEELQQYTLELGIEKYVDFAGFQSNPYPFMKKACVFALTSRFEGLSNVILEAMACGTPVVSTDCPYGPNEIIESGINGWLVPVGDDRTIAQKLIWMLENSSACEEMGCRALQRAQDFSVQKSIDAYLKEIMFLTREMD